MSHRRTVPSERLKTRSGLGAQAFGDRVQDLRHLSRRRIETVERGVSAGRELPAAGLAVEILNGTVAPVVAVADQSVDGRVGDPVIVTVGIRAGLATRVNRLLATPSAFPSRIWHD